MLSRPASNRLLGAAMHAAASVAGSSGTSPAASSMSHDDVQELEETDSLRKYLRRTTEYGTTSRPLDAGDMFVVHAILASDTLQGIALKHNVSIEQLRRINRLLASDSIFLRPFLLVPMPNPFSTVAKPCESSSPALLHAVHESLVSTDDSTRRESMDDECKTNSYAVLNISSQHEVSEPGERNLKFDPVQFISNFHAELAVGTSGGEKSRTRSARLKHGTREFPLSRAEAMMLLEHYMTRSGPPPLSSVRDDGSDVSAVKVIMEPSSNNSSLIDFDAADRHHTPVISRTSGYSSSNRSRRNKPLSSSTTGEPTASDSIKDFLSRIDQNIATHKQQQQQQSSNLSSSPSSYSCSSDVTDSCNPDTLSLFRRNTSGSFNSTSSRGKNDYNNNNNTHSLVANSNSSLSSTSQRLSNFSSKTGSATPASQSKQIIVNLDATEEDGQLDDQLDFKQNHFSPPSSSSTNTVHAYFKNQNGHSAYHGDAGAYADGDARVKLSFFPHSSSTTPTSTTAAAGALPSRQQSGGKYSYTNASYQSG